MDQEKIYTNDKYDITIIELKDKEFDLNNYLTIDNDIYRIKDLKEIYENQSIYNIHYPNGNEVNYSDDTIKYIDKNNNIYHCFDIDILNRNNCQVVGIHIGTNIKLKNVI